jgi:hypothetical protein
MGMKTPYRLNEWTIKQIIHHLADNDKNAIAYLRFSGNTEQSIL